MISIGTGSSFDNLLLYLLSAVPLASSAGLYLSALDYCSKLGGFAFVLNNGRGGLLISTTTGFDPKVSHSHSQFAARISIVCCSDASMSRAFGLVG